MASNLNNDMLISLAKSYQCTKDQVWIDQYKYEDSVKPPNISTNKRSTANETKKCVAGKSSQPQSMSEKLLSIRNTIQNALSQDNHNQDKPNEHIASTVKSLNVDMLKMNKLVQAFDKNIKNMEHRLNMVETNVSKNRKHIPNQDDTLKTHGDNICTGKAQAVI